MRSIVQNTINSLRSVFSIRPLKSGLILIWVTSDIGNKMLDKNQIKNPGLAVRKSLKLIDNPKKRSREERALQFHFRKVITAVSRKWLPNGLVPGNK